MSTTQKITEREIIITRLIEAPRALVWEAWSTPRHFAQWMGPTGFKTSVPEGAFQVGGAWRYTMTGPDGKVWPNRVVFRAMTPPSQLNYDHYAGEEAVPHFVATVTFEAQGDNTLVTLHSVFPSAEALRVAVETYGAVQGGQQTLSRLAEHAVQMRGAA